MVPLKPFQFADSSALSQRVALIQTLELSDLLNTATEHGDLGYFSASGRFFDQFQRLNVDEEAVIVVTVPPYVEVNWRAQTEDWLIPYNASDWDDGPLETMLRLGTGLLALDYCHAADVLERVQESLIVVYVLSDCVASVRYRWHPMILQSLEDLAQSTRFYQCIIAESTTYQQKPKHIATLGQLRPVYGSLRRDGTVSIAP